jgi:hypothetical protein
MKAILEFNFDNPEDVHAHANAIAGDKLGRVIYDLDDYLRGQLKYHELTDETYKAYELVREKIRELLTEEDLYSLIFN